MIGLHQIIAWDRGLFVLLNSRWTNHVFNIIMPAVTDFQKTRLCLFFILPQTVAVWVWRRRWRGVRTILALATVVGTADFLTARLLKPLFHRLRPEHAGIAVVLRAGRHGRYGFPSNHAANLFSAAGFLSQTEPALAGPVAAAGAVIAYSRVYVGAHFPLDVLCGACFGLSLGWAAGRLLRRWSRGRAPPKSEPANRGGSASSF